MEAARIRYELLVGTLLSKPAVATFRVSVTPTAVPRNTVYRFCIPADRDLSEALHRLTERDVLVLEIRRCPEQPRRSRGAVQPGPTAPPQEAVDVAAEAGNVVFLFPPGPGRRPSEPDTADVGPPSGGRPVSPTPQSVADADGRPPQLRAVTG